MTPTNQEIAQDMDKYEEAQRIHSETLTRVTTLLEAFVLRLASVEADVKSIQMALIDIGKALVRYEERDAATQKWVAVAISALVSLVVGVAMFLLGYFIR